MKIKLLDYTGTRRWVEIPDGSGASGVILSGDMVMQEPVRADASTTRMQNFYDGSWSLRADQIESWNKFGDLPYAILDFMEKENQTNG